jgi:phosphate-selective porin OprO and OprP
MKGKFCRCIIAVFFTILVSQSYCQQAQPSLNFSFKKGRGFGLVAADSSFSLNFQFRMQNRAAYVSSSERNLSPESFEFRVRRLRLKFDGFVYNPKITYYLQLSFSRGDMDWRNLDNSSVNSSPNVIRDAVIYYTPLKELRFGFGQTKLPGNRQRVVSSGDLQFADRSIVNAAYNIDRDFGFFAQYIKEYYGLRGAVTSGEGRNSVASNRGLAYTGRLEFLPTGKFTGNNDYIEGDLERESVPKVSFGVTYSYNDKAVRQFGQLGNDLYEPRTIRTFETDVLFKYNGWALYTEYMERHSGDPVTEDAAEATVRFVNVGRGFLSQLSYLFPNNFEVAARFSETTPFKELYNNPRFPALSEKKVQQIEFGMTKYLVGHRLKIQANVIHGNRADLNADNSVAKFWSAVFQVELGI